MTDLDLVPPTPELMAQVLDWRNRPDVTQWLMRTTVDPVRYTQAWLDSGADPLDHSSIVHVDGRAVATGSLEIRNGSGQFGHEPEYEHGEGLVGYLVDPAYAGRGIATAVTTALLEVADSWHAEHGWLDGYTYAILADEWRGIGTLSG